MDNVTLCNFLVVEDSNFQRMAMVNALRERGVEQVHTAVDGLEAILAAREIKPEVILLDIEMPNLDGATAVGLLRIIDRNSHIILVSSKVRREQR